MILLTPVTLRAAALFAGVGRQLHAVAGEHVAPDQAQAVAGHEQSHLARKVIPNC